MEMTEVLSIITTSILAIAFLLTYMVQRARYLKEIEPDLVLKTSARKIRVNEIKGNLKQFWNLYIDIDVTNITKKHAEELKYRVDLTIHPDRKKAKIIKSTIPELVYEHPRNLLPERRILVPVYIGWNVAQDLYKKIKSSKDDFETEKVGMEADITICYKSEHELLLHFLLPIWYQGRARYERKVGISWYFEENIHTDHIPPFIAVSWDKHDIIEYIGSGENI